MPTGSWWSMRRAWPSKASTPTWSPPPESTAASTRPSTAPSPTNPVHDGARLDGVGAVPPTIRRRGSGKQLPCGWARRDQPGFRTDRYIDIVDLVLYIALTTEESLSSRGAEGPAL